jgi:hypothetical protein
MITELAALVLVTGTACYLIDRQSICAAGIWITSLIIATLCVVADPYYKSLNQWLFIVAVVLLTIFAEIGCMKDLALIEED